MRIFIGGLIPDISVEDIEKRFSVNKNVTIKGVDVIRREDGQCKGFAYIDVDTDNEDFITLLRSKFNGTKWRGKVLK